MIADCRRMTDRTERGLHRRLAVRRGLPWRGGEMDCSGSRPGLTERGEVPCSFSGAISPGIRAPKPPDHLSPLKAL